MASHDLPALLDRYERPLIRYACGMVGDLDSARDVVQEAFIKLARGEMHDAGSHGRSGSDGAEAHGSHLEAWLFTVVRNRALDHIRIIPRPWCDEKSRKKNTAVTIR